MMTLERPGGPPPAGPGSDGGGRGGNPPDGSEPRLWPLIALAVALLIAGAVLALVLPAPQHCHLAVSLTGKPHYILICP
jgi:hypothetical protein